MKFVEGMLVGGVLTIGATVLYNEVITKKDTRKMMKKGRQLVKKMGLM